MDRFDAAKTLIEEFLDLPETPKKRAGKGTGIPIDWTLGERLFVEGELVGTAEQTKRVYPSFSEIGRRLSTTKENVQGRSRRYNWPQLREEFQKANSVVSGMAEDSPVKYGKTNSRKRSRRSAEQILLEYVDHFSDAVRLKTVRFDTINDLDKALRLLAFVRGQHESTKTVRHVMSLETMSQRHSAHRDHMKATLDDGVAGVLTSEGQAIDVTGVVIEEHGQLSAHVPAPVDAWQMAELRASDT